MSKLRREFKNVVYNFTDAEVKVRDATSNDPWGPSGTVMSEIAEFTFHVQAYGLVMGMLWKRLNDHGKNWRHVYKALVVLDYIVKSGSERVVQQCKDNIFSIETLQDFQYIDKDGKDNGNLVREKAKTLVTLLKDDARLREERERAAVSRERNTATTGFGSDSTARRSSPRPANTATSSSSSRTNHPQSVSDAGANSSGTFRPHIDQSRPSAQDEEELQLQLALRMSKEQADEEEKLRKQEEESLKIALEMSKQDNTEEQEEETPDDNNTGDLLGSLADPWAGGNELPPSYDLVAGGPVTAPSDPFANKDPFAPPTIKDPFAPTINKDPFAPPTISKDPFAPPPVSGPWGVEGTSPPPIGFDVTPSTSTWTSFSPTSTSMTDPFAPLPTISGGGGVANTSEVGGANLPTSFDLSAFNAPLASIPASTTVVTEKKPTVEESFLGSNSANLVNLDSLIAPLPPPTSINPFGIPPPAAVTPPTARSSNPFDSNKPPAPTLAQLKQGPTFDPLPPPLLPGATSSIGATTTTNTSQFNPFS